MPDYIEFDRSIAQLGIIIYEEKRIVTSIIVILKLLRGNMDSNLTVYVSKFKNITTSNTRKSNMFRTNNSALSCESPIPIGMQNIDNLQSVIDMNESIKTISLQLLLSSI